jgi:hypothetical protein
VESLSAEPLQSLNTPRIMPLHLADHRLVPLLLLLVVVFPSLFPLSCLVSCWSELSPSGSGPAARQGHSAVVWKERAMIVFGGRTVVTSTLNSTLSVLSFSNSSCVGMGGCNELSAAGVCSGCVTSSDGGVSCSCQCNDGFSGNQCQLAAVDSWLNDVVVYDIVNNQWTSSTADPVGTINPVPWSPQPIHHTHHYTTPQHTSTSTAD